MEYHGKSESMIISMETQDSGMALEHLRYDGEAVWYDAGYHGERGH